MLRRRFLLLPLFALGACAREGTRPRTSDGSFEPGHLAKNDIDRVVEAHQREIFVTLRVLAEKLYRRNPREWRRGGDETLDAALARIFTTEHEWKFPALEGRRGTQAIQLAFRDDFRGDRVLAFISGLGSMIQTAFREKTEFFMLDDLDAQALYNAARNVEIAVWKLSSGRTPSGELYLLSNEMSGSVINLSFEREFGKVIAGLDILSKVVSSKQNRAVTKVIQSLATAVFLPIPIPIR